MNRLRSFGLFLALLLTFPTISARGDEALPKCMSAGKQLGIGNAQVSEWKHSTPNQFLARARVHGVLSQLYPTKNGHAHFAVEFDGGVEDTLEVVYSLSFGALPRLAVGMEIEACGDYITSTKATSRYPASPDGAIIHWIHRATSPGHESGYLAIDGRVYGGAH